MAHLPARPPVIMITETNPLPQIDGIPTLAQIGLENRVMSTRLNGGIIQPGQGLSVGRILIQNLGVANQILQGQAALQNEIQQLVEGQAQLVQAHAALQNQVQQLVEGQAQLVQGQAQLVQAQAGIQNQINNVLMDLQHLQAQFNAGRHNDAARNHNKYILKSRSAGMYRQLIKLNPGHPEHLPPQNLLRLDLLNQNQPLVIHVPVNGFGIGDDPPLGLTPRNEDELNYLGVLAHQDKLNALRGIAWFYNDNTIQIQANANQAQVSRCMQNFRFFFLGHH